MTDPKRKKAARGKTWTKIATERYSEIGVPGFWSNLESNCAQWAREVSISPFWSAARESLPKWRNEFRSKCGGDLLAAPGLPDFVGKGEKRILEKIESRFAADANSIDEILPESAAPIPGLSDLVRTRVPCRFIDGVEFIAGKFYELAKTHDLSPVRSREGRLEGYFAQHLTFESPFIFRFGGANRSVEVICELQLATVLSTRVWEETHAIYEGARVGVDIPEEWQWNPRDPRFVSRQLGHMIHLADGLLCQLRGRVFTARTRKGQE